MKEEVNESAAAIEFNAEENEIVKSIASGGAKILRLLNLPVSIIPKSYQETNVTILACASSN